MKEFSMKDIFPVIEEGINSGGKYRFYPKGISMLPLIREGVDSVELCRPENIGKYDMILYLRDSGAYVLHRVVGVRDGVYDLCGDNQCVIEKGIRPDQIKAVATALYHGDEYITLDNKDYIRYAKRRVASIWRRRFAAIVKSYIDKIKG